MHSIPDDWSIGLSGNGSMKSEIFIEYIEKTFWPYLKKKNLKFLVILFVDGHKTHLTLQLSEFTKLNIILISLYPNAKRILQAADEFSFKPPNSYWKHGVLQWRKDNPYIQMGMQHFAPILAKSFLQPTNLINGFRACGLYQWYLNSNDYSKCVGKQLPTNDEKCIRSQRILTSDVFLDIVGDKLIVEIQNNTNVCDFHYSNVPKTLYDRLVVSPNNDLNKQQFPQDNVNDEVVEMPHVDDWE